MRHVKQWLRGTIKRSASTLKTQSEKVVPPPHGVDVFSDIRLLLPHYSASIVFDVGANVGTVAKRFVQNFPQAIVYCFEPVPDLYQTLVTNTKHLPVRCLQVAISNSESTETMRRIAGHGLFSLKETSGSEVRQEEIAGVHVRTLDSFCQGCEITCIDYLKIDTGGNDEEVLKGAAGLFASQSIAIIEVEAGMNPDSPIFSRFEVMKSFLEGFDYRLFGIYEQVAEWPTKEPNLRRTNSVFVSREQINRNRRIR